MDEFDFFMDEDEYAIEEAEEFDFMVDHEAGLRMRPLRCGSLPCGGHARLPRLGTRCAPCVLSHTKSI